MSAKVFNPQRLNIVRMRRMLTVRQLAKRIDVRPRTVMRWFNLLAEPNAKTIDKVVQALDWPREFFFGDDLEQPDSEHVSFRNVTG